MQGIRVLHVGHIQHVKGLARRPYNTREIIERNRQIRSSGVRCGLGKNDIWAAAGLVDTTLR